MKRVSGETLNIYQVGLEIVSLALLIAFPSSLSVSLSEYSMGPYLAWWAARTRLACRNASAQPAAVDCIRKGASRASCSGDRARERGIGDEKYAISPISKNEDDVID